MGDILPPKRQTVVDRLRRRIELYCRNQSTCLPRSQQRTNGLSTQQTHQLKRGHLENQVKSSSPCQKSHPRLTKRSREFIEDLTDPSEPEKHKHRKNHRHKDVPFQGSLCNTQEEEKDIPSFSVQIVQQFTKVPHSQTIQTNVTVKAVPPTKRNSKSPLPSHLSSSENLSTLGNSPSCSSVGTNVNYKESNSSAVEDRLINSLPSFGFPEESNNDVIHPDVLKDLIDDVLTNESPSGLMKDIDFDDSVGSSENKRVKTNADVNGLTMNMGKDLNKTSPLQGHFPPPPNGHYTSPHSPVSSSLFSPPVTTSFPSSMSSGFRLSLDFKLTEPSPAALTLKQMAEQHQSMQQKQQQQFGMDCGFPHSRYPFRRDGFQNTLASGRTTFLNGPTSNMNSLQNSHANDVLSPGMSTFGARTNGGIFKDEGGSSGVYDVRPMTDLDVRIKESDLHKPPGLIQRCHVNGPDQRHVAPTSVSYGATRPLSHFTDPGIGRTASLSPQSSPYFQGQSPRLIQQYNSPVPRSPSAPSLQFSQSQQLRFSPGSQQLQVSQGQQLHITQDPKSASSTHNSQQQSTTYGNYPSSTLHSSGPFQMNLSQSQSVTLNTHYPPGGNSHSNINRVAVNHQQMTAQGAMSTPIHPQQSRVSQFPMRPSPHYKPHRVVSQPQHSPQIVMGNGSMMRYEHNMTPNFNHPDPTVTPTVGATTFHQLQNSSFLTQESQHPQIVGHRNASHSDPRFPQSVHQPNMPSSSNIIHNQPSYNSALSRPPNVNTGPDGVNISHQQLPGTGVQWRNSFPQQEQSQLQVGVIGQSAAPWFPQQSPHMTPNIRPVAMDNVQKTVMSPHVQNLNTMMHHHQQGTRRMTPLDERNEVSVSGGDVISQSEPFRRKGHPQTGVMEEQPQFHLDFLDNIESSATDLLSFDQVMSTGNTNFDILEDMGIMGK